MQSGGARESEKIESVTVTDVSLVPALAVVKVKSTFCCFVSSFAAGENGNGQYRTDAVNSILQKRAGGKALCQRARLMEGAVCDSRSMSGFMCPVWHTALWQLCCTWSTLKTMSDIRTRALSLPLFPALSGPHSVSHSPPPGCHFVAYGPTTRALTHALPYALAHAPPSPLFSCLSALVPSLGVFIKVAPSQVTRVYKSVTRWSRGMVNLYISVSKL